MRASRRIHPQWVLKVGVRPCAVTSPGAGNPWLGVDMELTIAELELLLEALDTEGRTVVWTSGVSLSLRAGAGRLSAKVKTELQQRCLSAGLVRDLDIDQSKPVSPVAHETLRLRKLREVLELLAGGKTNAAIA